MNFTGGRWSSFAMNLALVLILLTGPSRALAGQDGKDKVLIFWTEQECLKAVTLMCIREPGAPVGIVAVPVYIKLNEGQTSLTIAEAYGRLGRQGLTERLEKLFHVPIGGYLTVDQSTLEKASDLIGPLVMEGKATSIVDVFEGTYTDGVIEPQSEIRHLAARLVEPKVLVKAPQLYRIFSSEVKTNLGCKNFWGIYRAVEAQGPEILQKKALTGRDYYVENRKYREVPPDAWVSVLGEVTRA